MPLSELSGLVRAFLSLQWSTPIEQLEIHIRLEDDLGMTGDDAAEFLEAFAREFRIDLAELEFLKHFGPEAGWHTLPGYGLYPVTVGHLVEVAGRGRWFLPPRSDAAQ